MTAGSNRQHVLDFLNVLYSGDVEAALARCTDDVEFLANAPIDILPHMGHRRGKAEMREMWDAVRARYSELRCEVPVLVAEDDKVCRVHPRVLPQEHQSAHGAVRRRRLLHSCATAGSAMIREVIDTFDLVQQLLERDIAAILTGRRQNPI